MTLTRCDCGRAVLAAGLAAAVSSRAAGDTIIQTFGDMDLLNQSSYPSDPTAGATLAGLAPDVITFATREFSHANWPFSPEADDLGGTDTIYAGAFSYSGGDGYSGAPERVNGMQRITVEYGSLIPSGHVITSFTLGIAADDFQFPSFGNEYIGGVNVFNTALSAAFNSLDQTGPTVRFFTIGIDPADLLASHSLTLLVAQADTVSRGDPGPGDGWAIDFLTVGIETVPTPGSVVVLGLAVGAMWRRRRG